MALINEFARARRLERHLTLDQLANNLAKKYNVPTPTKSTLSRFETGKSDLSTSSLMILCAYLNLPLDDVVQAYGKAHEREKD